MSHAILSERKFRHVNNHLTPLAALVVIPGLVVADVAWPVRALCIGLMAYSIFLNYLSLHLLGQNMRLIGKIRVGSNYIVNICLLWLLYAEWPLVWVLLLLMAIGVAVYQSHQDCLRAAAAFSLMLLAVHWNFGRPGLESWITMGVEAFIIVFFSLFVNGLLGISPLEPNGQDDAPENDALQSA